MVKRSNEHTTQTVSSGNDGTATQNVATVKAITASKRLLASKLVSNRLNKKTNQADIKYLNDSNTLKNHENIFPASSEKTDEEINSEEMQNYNLTSTAKSSLNISNETTASPNSNTSLDLSKKSSTSSSNEIEYIV